MELSTPTCDPRFRLEDLRELAEIGLLRLPVQEAESRRAKRMQAVVASASELSRRLASHTHCMLVNCQGSHGVGNLVEESEQLHSALTQYAELVRSVVTDCRRAIDGFGTIASVESGADPRGDTAPVNRPRGVQRRAG
jgi:uncharacterized membrane protein YccC